MGITYGTTEEEQIHDAEEVVTLLEDQGRPDMKLLHAWARLDNDRRIDFRTKLLYIGFEEADNLGVSVFLVAGLGAENRVALIETIALWLLRLL